MKARPLSVPDAWEFTPEVFADVRGEFFNWYVADALADVTGRRLELAQTNHSTSRAGALRGVHFTEVPPGQAKYVYCPHGAVLDVLVDLRVGSPTFGRYDAVRLDDIDHRAVYAAEGLGHAVLSLRDGSVLSYLCSTGYDPARERGVSPLDPALDLPWPSDVTPVLLPRDASAPTVAEAVHLGLLPSYVDCRDLYDRLRKRPQGG